jgi:cephalosporin-C deacetylase-like acetyl esterase
MPRQYEHHARKIEDLKAGLRFLADHPSIDASRIGAVGVCLGAGYSAWASVGEPLVKAVGLVAGYYRDPAEMHTRDPDGFHAKVMQGVSAREHYERTGEALMIPAVALDGDAAMQTADTMDYYTRRAAVPAYRNAFAVMSREHFLPFDVQTAAPRLTAPVLMIHSEAALSPVWARRFHNAITAPKRLEWLASRGQTDFYDDPGLVGQAADWLAAQMKLIAYG